MAIKRVRKEVIAKVLDDSDSEMFSDEFKRGMLISLASCRKAIEELCASSIVLFLKRVCTPAAFALYIRLHKESDRRFSRASNASYKALEKQGLSDGDLNAAWIEEFDKYDAIEAEKKAGALYNALSKGVSRRKMKKLGLTDKWPW